MSSDVLRRLAKPDSWITVEVEDLYRQAESQESGPIYLEENLYKVVEMLENGWIRCVHSREVHDEADEFDTEDVDYYPPNRIHAIRTAEEEQIDD